MVEEFRETLDMRIKVIAGAALAMLACGTADAQRMVAHGPGAGYAAPGARGPAYQPVGRPAQVHPGNRWGSKVGGRWWAGSRAPGGWGAYRRPVRGWALPSFWVGPQFFISDWSIYGLGQPPYGYHWARYYDDAVLIDGRGTVYDSVDGIDWDQYDGDYAYAADYGAGDQGVYAGPDERGYADRGYYRRRDDGVGGAVTGAVVGGVAGNLIAGRGNRLGGTLIGAGVGAAAGYAIDRGASRRRYDEAPPPPPPVAYDEGPGASYAPPPPPRAPYFPPVRPGEPAQWVSPDGRTSVVSTTSGGYYGTGVTTVTVQTAPIVTTTTTEIYENDAVTYSKPHRTYRKHVWHRAPVCGCS